MTKMKFVQFLSFTMAILSVSSFIVSSLTAQERSFEWKSTGPLVSPIERPEDPCYSVKDPSIVHYKGMNYLFMTIRSVKRTHQVEFLSFADWKNANKAERVLLKIHPGYYCAPQVFYCSPHKKWYMICQASSPDWKRDYGGNYGPAFCTTDNIADPNSWSPLKPMDLKCPVYHADNKKRTTAGLDYWVICDDTKAHLFFTTNNGDMWREETTLDAFPYGWSEPKLAIHGDIFEASHTYKIKGKNQYLTIIEAINKKALDNDTDDIKGHRVYKAYIADQLDGEWKPLAASNENLFAGVKNVQFNGPVWTENFSHGELFRSGYDEKMEIDPTGWKLLYQGTLDKEIRPRKYGEIPWKLGILEQK